MRSRVFYRRKMQNEKDVITIFPRFIWGNSDDYDLQVYYKEQLMFEESIRLNSLLNLNPDTISINIERYDIDLKILDKWGLSPGIDLNPI